MRTPPMNLPPHNPDLVGATDGFSDPDATNGLRAESARNAMLYHQMLETCETDPDLKTEVT